MGTRGVKACRSSNYKSVSVSSTRKNIPGNGNHSFNVLKTKKRNSSGKSYGSILPAIAMEKSVSSEQTSRAVYSELKMCKPEKETGGSKNLALRKILRKKSRYHMQLERLKETNGRIKEPVIFWNISPLRDLSQLSSNESDESDNNDDGLSQNADVSPSSRYSRSPDTSKKKTAISNDHFKKLDSFLDAINRRRENSPQQTENPQPVEEMKLETPIQPVPCSGTETSTSPKQKSSVNCDDTISKTKNSSAVFPDESDDSFMVQLSNQMENEYNLSQTQNNCLSEETKVKDSQLVPDNAPHTPKIHGQLVGLNPMIDNVDLDKLVHMEPLQASTPSLETLIQSSKRPHAGKTPTSSFKKVKSASDACCSRQNFRNVTKSSSVENITPRALNFNKQLDFIPHSSKHPRHLTFSDSSIDDTRSKLENAVSRGVFNDADNTSTDICFSDGLDEFFSQLEVDNGRQIALVVSDKETMRSRSRDENCCYEDFKSEPILNSSQEGSIGNISKDIFADTDCFMFCDQTTELVQNETDYSYLQEGFLDEIERLEREGLAKLR